ncbi:TonB-dependent receptor [Aeromonas hydrophila]|uniref:TonB-dependent receptor n=1 Tax=Aeromonas hydrophila TaxID=644 RepID=UPI0024418D6B|nr:TonB-dependent receptor [Aeromonas hydrophila]
MQAAPLRSHGLSDDLNKPTRKHNISEFALLVKTGVLCTAISTTPNVLANTNEKAQSQYTELEVITVTAEKRNADIMDVSSSVSAVTDTDLKDAEISSITELSQHVPNLHIFTWGGSRENNIFIRGIGPGLFSDPTVGVYVDGVNYTNSGMFDLDLTDVERIEVLRGPQGTLYGGNSLAGVVNVITKKPDNFTDARLSVTADTLERSKISVGVNTPLIEDQLYGGLSLAFTDNNGHLTNIYNGKDYGGREDIVTRAKLRWEPTHTFESDLILDFQRLRGDSYALGSADFIKNNPDKVDHNFDGEDNRDAYGITLVMKNEFSSFDFTSITGWRDWDSYNSADQDASSQTDFIYHSIAEEEHKQFSQELRWASNTASDLQWLAGLYGYYAEYKTKGSNMLDYTAIGLGGPYADYTNVKKENSGYAAFGQVDYSLTERLTLTAGLRVDMEKRKADIQANNQSSPSVNIQGDKDFNEWLPKVGVSYTPDNSSLTYVTISQGYRAGGFDHLYPNQDDPTFDSETSTNYELGYKASFLDNSLELSTALFYIDIKDQQVQQLVQSTNTIMTDNAGRGRSQGIEFETRYTPALGWLMELGGSYTDAEYKDYENCATTSLQSCSGNKMVNTPELTANFALQNTRPLTEQLSLFSRLDVIHVGEYYFNSLNTLKQNQYQLVNVKLGVEAKDWEVYLWAKNALNEYYSSVEFNFGSGHTIEAGDPQSFGLTFNTYF